LAHFEDEDENENDGVSEEFDRWRKGRQMDRKMRKGSGFGVQAGFFLNPGFSEELGLCDSGPTEQRPLTRCSSAGVRRRAISTVPLLFGKARKILLVVLCRMLGYS